jgi:hypothetical protein
VFLNVYKLFRSFSFLCKMHFLCKASKLEKYKYWYVGNRILLACMIFAYWKPSISSHEINGKYLQASSIPRAIYSWLLRTFELVYDPEHVLFGYKISSKQYLVYIAYQSKASFPVITFSIISRMCAKSPLNCFLKTDQLVHLMCSSKKYI